MASRETVIPCRLRGKVAVVAAGTLGIGYAVAERLAQEGASVMISSRQQDNVDKAVTELRNKGYDVKGVVCHVAKAGDRANLIKETVKHFGGIDILVSNAGTSSRLEGELGPILSTTEELWDKIFDVNVKAMFFLVKEVVPHLEKRGGGSVILVTSTLAYLIRPQAAMYAISKTALLGLVKNLAPQLAEMGIRVNGIAPGLIKTRMTRHIWSNDDRLRERMEVYAVKRAGIPEEMASIAAFLASDDASYITAETVVANGGGPSRL